MPGVYMPGVYMPCVYMPCVCMPCVYMFCLQVLVTDQVVRVGLVVDLLHGRARANDEEEDQAAARRRHEAKLDHLVAILLAAFARGGPVRLLVHASIRGMVVLSAIVTTPSPVGKRGELGHRQGP